MSFTPEQPQIRIGISSCLLGERVRFDGNHKRDSYIVGTLGDFFNFVPICPEVAIGLGTPREPIRLVGDPQRPQVVGVRTPTLEVTAPLERYGRETATRLDEISGYILKSKSPSCGMERVKVYQAGGMPSRQGSGVFARELMAARPYLPVEEEGRLGDPVLRENFLQRVFALHRWQQLAARPITPRRLVDFHTDHKLLVMAHGAEYYRALGRLVADAGSTPIGPLAERYRDAFMAALRHRATRKRHTNVLHHLMGYLKRTLEPEDKEELLSLIDAYRVGEVPLIVPLTLLRHHFRRHPHPYVARQIYMHPHPQELMLLNHI